MIDLETARKDELVDEASRESMAYYTDSALWHMTKEQLRDVIRNYHQHGFDCIEEDVVDMGDDGDGLGYQAWAVFVCNVTGEGHRNFADFGMERDDPWS